MSLVKVFDKILDVIGSLWIMTALNISHYLLLFHTANDDVNLFKIVVFPIDNTDIFDTWSKILFISSYIITFVIILVLTIMAIVDRINYNLESNNIIRKLRILKENERQFFEAVIYLGLTGGIIIYTIPIGIILNYIRNKLR